jgi:O-antigen ligase
LFAYKNGHFRFRLATRISVVLAVITSIGLYIRQFDPTLGLRTDVWRDYLTLWFSEPLAGVGDNGIRSYMEGPRMFSDYPPSHAHNVLLDTASRDGALVALFAIAAIIVLGVAAYSAIPRVGSGPLGLWTLVVAMSLTETTFNFIDFNQLYIALVAVLLLAGPGNQDAKGDAILRGEPEGHNLSEGTGLNSGSATCQS